MIKRDAKLLKSEGSYRRAYIGCKVFAGLNLIAFLSLLFVPLRDAPYEHVKFAFFSSVFWIAACFYCNGKIHHIESIQMYKKEIDKLWTFDNFANKKMKADD